jgi:hypothetical protein
MRPRKRQLFFSTSAPPMAAVARFCAWRCFLALWSLFLACISNDMSCGEVSKQSTASQHAQHTHSAIIGGAWRLPRANHFLAPSLDTDVPLLSGNLFDGACLYELFNYLLSHAQKAGRQCVNHRERKPPKGEEHKTFSRFIALGFTFET